MSSRNDEGRNQKLLASERDDHSEIQSRCPKTWKVAVVILFVCSLFLVGVVVGFYISQAYEPYRARCESGSDKRSDSREDEDELSLLLEDPIQLSKVHEKVVDFISNGNKELENIARFAEYQLQSGHSLDLELVDLLHEHFNACRFDDVAVETFNVMISLPDLTKPNRILAFDKISNQTIVETEFQSQTNDGRLLGFVAYSPNGSVEGELIYLNHGTLDDYDRIADKGLDGKIGLVRSGHSSLEEKVHLAECYGLVGLLIVLDSPELHHHSKHRLCTDVTPFSVFHASSGGDPLTPNFPAIDGVWRLPVDKAELPKIPVQTLSCDTARKLLHYLRQNGTLHLSDDSALPAIIVRLEINHQLVLKPIRNVIATLYGDKDSDYSILIGASRNSFNMGLSGGIPGTESLMKASSAISKLFSHPQKQLMWVPRRTIRFISWGGSDFGFLGFTEFLEKYQNIWRNKVVAYIDLDNSTNMARDSMAGSQIMITSSASTEVLVNLVIEQLSAKDSSVYETVWESIAKKLSAFSQRPNEFSIAAILRRLLPAPYIHLQVTEVADDSENLYGELEGSSSVAKVVSLLTLTLADSGVFHLQIHRSAQEAITDVNKLTNYFAEVLPNTTSEAFHYHLGQLKKSTVELEDYIRRHLEYDKPADVRMANSALLQLESEINLIQVSIAKLVTKHRANQKHCSNRDHQCVGIKQYEVQLTNDMSELLSQIMATTKVTDLAG